MLLDESLDCISPPCSFGGGGMASPEIQYQLTQPVTPVEPHPLTVQALEKANTAFSEAQRAADGEARNEAEIAKVGITHARFPPPYSHLTLAHTRCEMANSTFPCDPVFQHMCVLRPWLVPLRVHLLPLLSHTHSLISTSLYLSHSLYFIIPTGTSSVFLNGALHARWNPGKAHHLPDICLTKRTVCRVWCGASRQRG